MNLPNRLQIRTKLADGEIASGIAKTVAPKGEHLDGMRRDLSSADGYGLICTLRFVVNITLDREWIASLLSVEH